MNLAVGITAINANAESANIDILTGYNNTSNFFRAWGVQNRLFNEGDPFTTNTPVTPTYGQIITPTESQTTLNSFTFALKTIAAEGAGAPFEARIYNWGGTTVSGEPIFVSSGLTAPISNTYTEVKIDTGRLALTQGQQYVLVFTTSDTPLVSSNDTAYNFYSFNGRRDNYNGGYMVYSNNRNITSTWDGNSFFSAFDMAFIAIFAPSAADTLASMQPNA
jgi:hypothetical protein